MRKEAAKYDYWKGTPPFQPFVTRYTESYLENRMDWNPYCVEKDALFYQFVTDEEKVEIELVSDACLNVLFELDGADSCAWLSGTYLRPTFLTLKPNTTYFGFKPYTNLGFKSPRVNLRDLVDSSVDLTQAFPGAKQLISDIAEATSFGERTGVFNKFSWEHLIDHNYYPTFVDYLGVLLSYSEEQISLNNIDKVLGYSERHCREKFKDFYGISPKKYSDIIRFQNTLKALVFGWYEGLSALACECGYFDQAHLTRDFRRYTNESPGKYLEKYTKQIALKNGCV